MMNKEKKKSYISEMTTHFDKSESVISIKYAISHALRKNTNPSYLYGTGNASQKIVQHLEKIKLNHELIEKQLTY